MNYYLLCGRHTTMGTVSFSPNDCKLGHEMIKELEGKSEMPFEFSLKLVREVSNGLVYQDDLSDIVDLWIDYQANSFAWPMMSAKMKDIINQNLTGNECIDWISCIVKGRGEKRLYHIPRFNKRPDVLDVDKTIFVAKTDHVVIPWFSTSKIRSLSIFTQPFSHNLWKITPALYVNESVKRSIEEARMTGVDFERARVS